MKTTQRQYQNHTDNPSVSCDLAMLVMLDNNSPTGG
jgi:hypothetical protein